MSHYIITICSLEIYSDVFSMQNSNVQRTTTLKAYQVGVYTNVSPSVCLSVAINYNPYRCKFGIVGKLSLSAKRYP